MTYWICVISKFLFVSEVLEKVISKEAFDFFCQNDFFEISKSGFIVLANVETALLKVPNKLYC